MIKCGVELYHSKNLYIKMKNLFKKKKLKLQTIYRIDLKKKIM